MAGRYKIRTIAERSGFSATLLRAWERRYGFLSPQRQPSGHRLYCEQDLLVLSAVRVLLEQGQSIGEISLLGRDTLLTMAQEAVRPTRALPEMSETRLATKSSLYQELGPPLLEASRKLQVKEVRRLVGQAISCSGGLVAVRRFAWEVGHEAGELWAQGHLSVASEHLLSGVWKEVLHSHSQRCRNRTPDGRAVLTACFPEERHEVGLLFLKCELEQGGYKVTHLGPALPFEDLETALLRLQPSLLCLSVSRSALLEVHFSRFSELVQRYPGIRLLLGGLGVARFGSDLKQLGVWVYSGEETVLELLERIGV